MTVPMAMPRRLHWSVAMLLAAILAVAGFALLPAQAATWAAGEYVVLTDDAGAISVARAHGLTVETSTDGQISSFTTQLTARQAKALSRDPRVQTLSPNVTFTANADRITPAITRVGADQPPVSAGSAPSSTVGGIAILDSGVDVHPDYRLAGGTDCLSVKNYLSDTNGHGTGVAGVAASYSNGSGIVGSAPGASLYSVRILDSKLKGTLANVVCGLNWVAQNAAALDIRVVNMSFGTPGTDDGNCGATNNDALHQAICAVVAAGVVPVTAAGNSAKDFSSQVPAAYDEVLTATNMADFDGKPGGLATTKPCTTGSSDDAGAGASNYATTAADAAHTVAAPGECPFTTKKGPGYGYIQSGTSMSSGITSGVVLDCLQAGQPCAGQTPAQVINTVIGSAKAAAPEHGFTGDPNSQVGNVYRGYLITTQFIAVTDAEPTPTPTTTEASPTTTDASPTSEMPTTSEPTTSAPPTTTAPPTATAPPTTTAPPTDATAPSVQIVSPAAGTVVSGTVLLQATATDDAGVTAVKYYVGTTLLGSATLVADYWELNYDSHLVRNGTYSVVARAYDAAGRVGISAARSLTVRN